MVVSGDYCAIVCDKNKITLDDFYKWNPGVGVGTCDSLQLGAYVCVGYDARLDPDAGIKELRQVRSSPTPTPGPVLLP